MKASQKTGVERMNKVNRSQGVVDAMLRSVRSGMWDGP
jgi:hypothetical protein